jgi:DNA-binding transcriptional LysR family regulator
MELRHLRYFLRVAEELHFGRAARQLGISQPPLSQQIRALESELGVELFDRTSRRVELTEAGRLFLPEARRTLDQAAHAIAVARRAQFGETGELSIAFATSVPFVPIIAQALAAYRRRYPTIHLSLAELSRDAQIAGIADRRIDIGFVRGFEWLPLPDGLEAIQLIEEPLLVAIHEDHPLARENRPLGIADIADLPFVLYHQAMGVGFNEHIALLFRRHGREFRVAQEVSGLASLLGLVAAGLGVSVLVRSLAALHADHMVYRRLDEPDTLSRLWLVRGGTLSVAAQNFVDVMAYASPEEGLGAP